MMQSVLEEMVDVKRGETMANAVEASASTARPKKLKKEAAQGETAAARRDGAQQGNCQRTKEGESSRLPRNEHLTGTLEHRHQPQYQPESGGCLGQRT